MLNLIAGIIVILFILCGFSTIFEGLASFSTDSKIRDKYHYDDGLEPAEYDAIKEFLHGLDSLSRKHDIVGTPIFLDVSREEDKYIITARTTIYKIDGDDASDCIDVLRLAVQRAKADIKANNKSLDEGELYRLQSSKSDEFILDFYGVNHLQGSLWDIVDCEYVEGRYIEFEESVTVYDFLHQSQEKTFDAIGSFIKETYPKAQIEKSKNLMSITLY